ncbi:MAG TPA: hypothetical protein VIM33_07550 [Gaiellaceae bacterium]|jgi:hypothetical protein
MKSVETRLAVIERALTTALGINLDLHDPEAVQAKAVTAAQSRPSLSAFQPDAQPDAQPDQN